MIEEIYEDIDGFEKRNSCYKDDALVRFAFAGEELGEVAREVLREGESGRDNVAIATETFDVIWNLCGLMRSVGITPEQFKEAARAKMAKNKTRKFPTH